MAFKNNHNKDITDGQLTDELNDLLIDDFLEDEPSGQHASGWNGKPEARGTFHGPAGTRRDRKTPKDSKGTPGRRTDPRLHPDTKTGGRSRLALVNIVIAVMIVLVIAAIIISLVLWNRGTKSDYDRDAERAEYDIEVQDIITAQNPKDLEGHADDGITKILYLGNDMICDDISETGIAGQIEALGIADGTPIETVTAAFPGSEITCYNEEYSEASQHDMDDIFNFFYVANCVSLNDFSALVNVAAYHTDDPRYAASAETLAALDFSTVDMIVVAYNGQDYLNGVAPLDLSNPKNIATYAGAMTLGFERIHEACPYIRLVFLSPTFTRIEDANGELKNGDMVDLSGNGTMPTYWYQAIDVCCSEQVSFIDNYYGSVNGQNYEECMSDGVHLNSKGNEIIAKHFVYKILENGNGEFNYVTGTGTDVSGSGQTEQ